MTMCDVSSQQRLVPCYSPPSSSSRGAPPALTRSRASSVSGASPGAGESRAAPACWPRPSAPPAPGWTGGAASAPPWGTGATPRPAASSPGTGGSSCWGWSRG